MVHSGSELWPTQYSGVQGSASAKQSYWPGSPKAFCVVCGGGIMRAERAERSEKKQHTLPLSLISLSLKPTSLWTLAAAEREMKAAIRRRERRAMAKGITRRGQQENSLGQVNVFPSPSHRLCQPLFTYTLLYAYILHAAITVRGEGLEKEASCSLGRARPFARMTAARDQKRMPCTSAEQEGQRQ